MVDSAADTAAGEQQWCWATQAGDALVAMQRLVADAVAADAETIDAAALGRQVQLYRSAAQIGLTQTAARSTPLMRKHPGRSAKSFSQLDGGLRDLGGSVLVGACCDGLGWWMSGGADGQ